MGRLRASANASRDLLDWLPQFGLHCPMVDYAN
jgi:hypothetical protein